MAILVPLKKEMAAMLVSQTNPEGIDFYSYANFLFLFRLKNMAADHLSKNQQLPDTMYCIMSVFCLLSVKLRPKQ